MTDPEQLPVTDDIKMGERSTIFFLFVYVEEYLQAQGYEYFGHEVKEMRDEFVFQRLERERNDD